MALREMIKPFVWGEGGAQLSPEQIAREREIAQALGVVDTSPVGHWTQGAARMVNALSGRLREGRANRAEQANTDYNRDLVQSLFGGGSFPGAPSTGGGSSQPMDYASSRVAQAHDGGTEWIRYANQGATRSLPLNDKLTSALSFLPELGVQMEVFSGGQPAKGSGGARVGSTRHDHGNAADVFFYKDGRRLDWSNPDDLPIYEEIVRRGRAAGITGFGAGEGYMRPGSMHIGFGGEAVWGAGGKGSNAPDWLRNAYNSPMQVSNPVQAINGIMNDGPVQVAESEADVVALENAMAQQDTQAFNAFPEQPVQVAQASMPNQMSDAQALQLLGASPAQSGGINPALIQALSDPRASDQTRSIAAMLLQQQQQQNDPMRQLQLEKAQLEIDALRNPQPKQTAEMQNLAWRAQQAGLQPGTQEYAEFILTGGKGPENVTNVNVGGGDKFYENLDKKQGDMFATLSEGGINARSKLRQVERLGQLLEAAPTGGVAMLKQAAGDFGINTEGLDDIQAAQALINELVPQQRPPGSGPMSDADLELFKRSLPRIINQPGGNQMILETMRGVAEYQIQLGDIADAVANREMTPKEAREAMRSLSNPLEGILDQERGNAPSNKPLREMSDEELEAIINGQ